MFPFLLSNPFLRLLERNSTHHPPDKKEDSKKNGDAGEANQDEELENLRKKVQEMEEEDEKLRKMQDELESSSELKEDKEEVDSRSVYVGNVDYSVTTEELQQHFHASGTINRVTIMCDKWTGHPKGFAYIEFSEPDSVTNALLMNETLLKGRQLKVTAKRTNVPGYGRGRGRGYHGYRPFRGRGFRGRRPYYHPYS